MPLTTPRLKREHLTMQRMVERDTENAWLAGDGEAGPLDDLIGHSITYRIAVGPRAGQKRFTLQTVPPRLQGLEGDPSGAATSAPTPGPPCEPNRAGEAL